MLPRTELVKIKSKFPSPQEVRLSGGGWDGGFGVSHFFTWEKPTYQILASYYAQKWWKRKGCNLMVTILGMVIVLQKHFGWSYICVNQISS